MVRLVDWSCQRRGPSSRAASHQALQSVAPRMLRLVSWPQRTRSMICPQAAECPAPSRATGHYSFSRQVKHLQHWPRTVSLLNAKPQSPAEHIQKACSLRLLATSSPQQASPQVLLKASTSLLQLPRRPSSWRRSEDYAMVRLRYRSYCRQYNG